MEQVGARSRHRAPALYTPTRMYLTAMLMLAPLSGFTAGAAWDAFTSHHYQWAILLAVLSYIAVGLYFCVAYWLFQWLHPSDD